MIKLFCAPHARSPRTRPTRWCASTSHLASALAAASLRYGAPALPADSQAEIVEFRPRD